ARRGGGGGRVGGGGAPPAVVGGGGVRRARPPHRREPLLAGIRAYSPRAEVTVVTDPPVVGAALLALDALGALGAAPGTENVLREALRRVPDAALSRVW